MGSTLQNLYTAAGFVGTHLSELGEHYSISTYTSSYNAAITIYVYEDPEGEYLKAARKAIGPMKKEVNKYSGLYLEREIKESRLTIRLYPADGTCEKVQVGTRTVTEPDPAVEVPQVEVEEPIYEWECKGIN